MRLITRLVLFVLCPLGLAIASTLTEMEFQDLSKACSDCHRPSAQTRTRHFITSNDDCQFCHDVQDPGGAHKVTTVSDDVSCLSCHIEQDPSMQQASSHSELACRSCHNPHGSVNEFMLNQPIVSLCSETCHDEGDLGLSHPVGPGVTDQMTGQDMTCTSTCHSLHNPSEPKLLQLASIDLCAQCHAEKF